MTRYRSEGPPHRSGLRTVGRILLWIAIAVAMLVISFVAGLYLWFHESVAAIQAHSQDVKSAQKFLGEPPAPGHAAIGLVIGYDHRANEAANTPSRSDTVMLIRTDPATKTVSMMSFPRDLLVNVHCPGQPVFSGKINSAYAACGAKGTVQTVSDMIGLPINYLITVNFRGFKQIVNRLGGVWIDVDRRYFNDNAGLSPTFGYAKINLQPGYQLLSGGSALDYVRYRHTDSDLFRVARQQQFVKAMKYQFKHNFSVLKVPKIVGTLTKNIEVGAGRGSGVSGRTILSYAFFAYHLPPGHFFQTQIQGLSGYSDLTTSSTNIAAAVQDWETPDVDSAQVATAVALGRKVKLRTPTRAQTTITVLNGNGVAGAAGEAATGLSQQGYHILPLPPNATGNAPSFDYFHTTVLLEPAREAVGGGRQLRGQAVRAGRRQEGAADDRSAPEWGDAHRRRRAHVPRNRRARPAGARTRDQGAGTRAVEPVRHLGTPAPAAEEGRLRPDGADGPRQLFGTRLDEARPRLPDRGPAPRGAARLPDVERRLLGDPGDELARCAGAVGPELPPRARRSAVRLLLQRRQAPHDRVT